MWKFLLAAVLAFMSILIFFPFLLFLDSTYVFIFIVIGAYFIYLKFEENDDEHKTNTKSTQKQSNINIRNDDIKSSKNKDFVVVDRKREEEKLVKNIDSGNTVTDIDGNVYKTVKIGNQIWMAENLRVSRYRNGDLIPIDNCDYSGKVNKQAICSFHTKKILDNGFSFGLYNYDVINDNRQIAPEGWHVATDVEWETLFDIIKKQTESQFESITKEKLEYHYLTNNLNKWLRKQSFPSRKENGELSNDGIHSWWCVTKDDYYINLLSNKDISRAPYSFSFSQIPGIGLMNKQRGLLVLCVKDR